MRLTATPFMRVMMLVAGLFLALPPAEALTAQKLLAYSIGVSWRPFGS